MSEQPALKDDVVASFIVTIRDLVKAERERDEALADRDRLIGSLSEVERRLRKSHPDRLGSFEDANDHALLHIEAALAGRSRPFALFERERDEALATLARVRALADEWRPIDRDDLRAALEGP